MDSLLLSLSHCLSLNTQMQNLHGLSLSYTYYAWILSLVWHTECCCVCHLGQNCKKAELWLNLYPCVIKYYLSIVKRKTCMDFLSLRLFMHGLCLSHTHTAYSTTHHTQTARTHAELIVPHTTHKLHTHTYAILHTLICNHKPQPHKLTFPLILGSFEVSIFPTSHVIILETGSKEYFPWLGVKVTFRTALGNGTSTTTFSTWCMKRCIKHFLEIICHKTFKMQQNADTALSSVLKRNWSITGHYQSNRKKDP